ncbi:hypothetical protein INR49_003987 [Caranx melampygus]|nr:hypothetical protein INR49_003987 [Caranx melampygus]
MTHREKETCSNIHNIWVISFYLLQQLKCSDEGSHPHILVPPARRMNESGDDARGNDMKQSGRGRRIPPQAMSAFCCCCCCCSNKHTHAEAGGVRRRQLGPPAPAFTEDVRSCSPQEEAGRTKSQQLLWSWMWAATASASASVLPRLSEEGRGMELHGRGSPSRPIRHRQENKRLKRWTQESPPQTCSYVTLHELQRFYKTAGGFPSSPH